MSINSPREFFPLVKKPSTLLELFRLRTGGHLPDTFSTTIQGSVDVADMYGADTLLNSTTAGTTGAFPIANGSTPFGSAVRLHTAGSSLSLGAAGVASGYYLCRLLLQDLAGTNTLLFSGSFQAPAAGFANGTVLAVGGQLPYPRVIPPGFRLLTVWYSNDPSALHTANLDFEFENLIV